MKLIMAIVSKEDSVHVSKALNTKQFYVTKVASSGGFLSNGNTTLMCGVEDDRVNEAIEIIKTESQTRKRYVPSTISYEYASHVSIPTEVFTGGATIFVLDVEQFMKI